MAICNRKGSRVAWEWVKTSRGKALVNHGGVTVSFSAQCRKYSIKIGGNCSLDVDQELRDTLKTSHIMLGVLNVCNIIWQ